MLSGCAAFAWATKHSSSVCVCVFDHVFMTVQLSFDAAAFIAAYICISPTRQRLCVSAKCWSDLNDGRNQHRILSQVRMIRLKLTSLRIEMCSNWMSSVIRRVFLVHCLTPLTANGQLQCAKTMRRKCSLRCPMQFVNGVWCNLRGESINSHLEGLCSN